MIMRNKKSQHEIAGFVLIVLIVSVIGVVFLSIAFGRGEVSRHSSVEVSKLLESAMYYTTDCAVNYIPQYRDIQDLVKECHKSQSGNYRECLVKVGGVRVDDSQILYGSAGSGKKFSLNPRQGPWEHIPGNARGGTASAPLLIASDLIEGEEIRVSNIEGTIRYTGSQHDCRTSDGTYGYAARAGFYNKNYELIDSEYNLRDFESGISVPIGAVELYAYIRETEAHKTHYQDNTGPCTFAVHRGDDEESYGGFDGIEENIIQTETNGICDSLDRNLRNLLDLSLDVGEGHVNKAYALDIYYSYDYEESQDEDILLIEEGDFSNCSAVVGGYHPIYISSSSSGEINVDILLCKS